MRVLACLLLLVGSCAARATELDPQMMERAEAAMADGKPADALDALQQRQQEFAGTPRFDYLLGLAALDAGKPDVAIPAFERVLKVAPNFAGARFELAHAHFDAGHKDLARAQFSALLDGQPSPATRVAIERYMAELEGRPMRDLSESQLSWFVDVGAGFDSNANGSTSDTQFLGFTLSPQLIAKESSFGELGAGFSWTKNPTNKSNIAAFARAVHRANPEASFVDQTVTYAGATYTRSVGKSRVSLGVSGFNAWLDGRQHQVTASVDIGVSRFVNDKVEIAAVARAGVVTFERLDLQPLDVDRYLGGIALTKYGLRRGTARLGAALLGGRDEARRPGSPFGNDKFGARVYGAIAFKAQRTLYAEALYLDSRYDGRGFFGAARRDREAIGFVGFDMVDWPRKNWIVSPQLRISSNRSTIRLYEYDRVEGMLFVRRQFH